MTTLNALKELGFKAKIKIKKPLLTKKHKLARYEWAKAHQSWTVGDWKKVIWSDKTKVNIWNSDGIKYYWKYRNNPIKDFYLETTVKYGGGSLIIWGYMTYYGVGYICQVYDGTMKSEDYIYILDNSLKDTMDYYNLDKSNIIFQYDNDPKHTSAKTKAYLTDQQLNVLP
jgi:hypothetical protein